MNEAIFLITNLKKCRNSSNQAIEFRHFLFLSYFAAYDILLHFYLKPYILLIKPLLLQRFLQRLRHSLIIHFPITYIRKNLS